MDTLPENLQDSEDMISDEFRKEVALFNKYDDSTMEIEFNGWFFVLYIDNKLITESGEFEVLARIKGINNENGYNYLDD